MNEPRYRTTPPRWAVQAQATGQFAGAIRFGSFEAEPPVLGLPGPTTVRMDTRLLPTDGGHSMPATVVRDVLEHTQRLMFIAGHVAAFGANPDFSDVRTLDKAVQKVATLSVSPFEGGSFVIPAELPAEAVVVHHDGRDKAVAAADVAKSFALLMQRFIDAANLEHAAAAPIGFIQTVQDLGKVLGRHASGVEYTPDTFEQAAPARPIVVDRAFVSHAESAHRYRAGRPYAGYGSVAGRLVGMDILANTVKIQVIHKDDRSRTISGTFHPSLSETLARQMGFEVQVFGVTTYHRNQVKRIAITEVIGPPQTSE